MREARYLGACAKQLRRADGFVDDGERVTVGSLGLAERFDRAVEEPHQAADVFRRRYIGPFLGVLAARERVPDQLVHHVERDIGKPDFQLDQKRRHRCAPPVRRIALDHVGGRGQALAGELAEAGLMDPARGIGLDSDIADESELVDHVAHVVRLRRTRDGLQPRERRKPGLAVDDRQVVERGELRIGEAGEESVRGPLAGAGATRDGGALDHRRCGQDDFRGSERRDDPGHNRQPPVGSPCRLRRGLDDIRQITIGRSAEPEGTGDFAGMVAHGLWPACVLGERGRRDIDLHRHPVGKRVDRFSDLRQRQARVTEEHQLHREAEAVRIAAPSGHEVQVRSGQGVMAGQCVPICGNAEHLTTLLLRQQLPPCHGSSAVQKAPMLIVDTDD